jgi:hypothetical protein
VHPTGTARRAISRGRQARLDKRKHTHHAGVLGHWAYATFEDERLIDVFCSLPIAVHSI